MFSHTVISDFEVSEGSPIKGSDYIPGITIQSPEANFGTI
jgi:hypothetical protein